MKLRMHIKASEIIDVHALEREVSKELEDVADDVRVAAKVLVPVDTGALIDSIKVDGSNMTYDVVASTDYARYIEYGTSPHWIHGKPFLFFDRPGPYSDTYWTKHPVTGKYVYGATKVYHPGNRAYLYMTRAFDDQTTGIDIRIRMAIDRVL